MGLRVGPALFGPIGMVVARAFKAVFAPVT